MKISAIGICYLSCIILIMLKQIENATLWCPPPLDITITFDDGKIFPKNDPKIHSFFRRKKKAISVSAKFHIAVTIGKYTSVLPIEHNRPNIVIEEDAAVSIDELLKQHADDILKLAIFEKAAIEPFYFNHNGTFMNESYWLFDGKFYKDTDSLKADEVKALLLTRTRMRKARINRAKTIAHSVEPHSDEVRRGFISEDVRLLVWQRDGGKCSKCGSRNELQFDHIIPFSLGGSSTQDNLQILCGPCNRLKSNSVA